MHIVTETRAAQTSWITCPLSPPPRRTPRPTARTARSSAACGSARRRRRPAVSGDADFPGEPGRALHQGLDVGRHARASRAADVRRWSATRAAPSRRPPGTRRSTAIASGIRAVQGRHGKDAVGVFGSGALTNEKAYLLGKFARVGARHAEHRLQRPLLHVLGGGRGRRGVRPRSRAAVPARRHRRAPTPSSSSASNAAETMPPVMQYFDAQRARRRHADRRRSAPHRHRAGATLHLPLTPGTDAALANGLLHVLIRDGAGGPRRTSRERTEGFEQLRGVVAALLAGARRAHHRRARGDSSSSAAHAARRGAIGDGAHRARRRAAGAGRDQHARVHQPRARARAGRPAVRRLRHASPGRATARAAASTARRRISSPATGSMRDPAARRARRGGLGRDPDASCRGAGIVRLRAARRARHATAACARCSVFGSNPVVSAPRARPHRASACARSTCSSSRTSSSPRPRRSPTSCCRSRSGPRRRAR